MSSQWKASLPAIVMLGLVSTACLGQEAREERIDVGGYRLFTSRAGVGEPLVVFEAGLGEDVSTWQKVLPEVSKWTGTLAYDRAGLGKSDPSPDGKSVEALVAELHKVLNHTTQPSSRYVLVGHSLGGAVVELYAHKYPSEVAGLVLVDPEDGRLLEQLEKRLPKSEWDARQKMMDQMMQQASPAQKAELEASKESGEALAGALPPPSIPVVLLTGTLKDPGFPGNPVEQDLKVELQKQYLAKIPQSRHVLVPNSRHYIQEDAPELVIQAIHDVVTEARQKGGPTT